jgi:lipoprotein-anchoring transpeptidase ErfK/SrfK
LAGAATATGFALVPRTAFARALPAPAGAEAAAVLAADKVYFAETGHLVSGLFWQNWRAYGLDAFGYPISEAFEDGGVLNQYFQRARFELAPDNSVRLGLLGLEAGAAEPPPAPGAVPPGARVVAETGHSVTGAFLPAYDRWRTVIGPPVASEQATGGGYVQYFAHARLEWDAQNGTRLGLLGSEIVAQRRVDTAPVAMPDEVFTWGDFVGALAVDEAERRSLGASASGSRGFVPEYGQKWVAVSIPRQRVTAYEGTKQVFTDLVSTGAAAKGQTPTGIFAINRRVANETMDSTTIGIPKGDPRYYRLENVLYTQYFDNAGSALHYAWWHNNFGQPMSYGCVNLRLTTAKWFWDWAGIGTPVVVA